ncbi:hypothetical protein WDW89_17045, partial [Deltaproteobacteria bacterium TL4]
DDEQSAKEEGGGEGDKKEGGKEGGKSEKKEKTTAKSAAAGDIGVKGAISKEVQVYSIPFSYSLTSALKLALSVPYILTQNDGGTGNALVALKLLTNFSEQSAMLTVIGSEVPSGDEKVGSGKVATLQFSQSFLRKLENSRILGSYSLAYKPKDENDYDKGDSIGLFVGFDHPLAFLGAQTSGYLGVMARSTQEDQIREVGIGNQQEVADTTLGLVFRNLNLRLGLTFPTYLKSDFIENSDRSPIFDFGFRFSF